MTFIFGTSVRENSWVCVVLLQLLAMPFAMASHCAANSPDLIGSRSFCLSEPAEVACVGNNVRGHGCTLAQVGGEEKCVDVSKDEDCAPSQTCTDLGNSNVFCKTPVCTKDADCPTSKFCSGAKLCTLKCVVDTPGPGGDKRCKPDCTPCPSNMCMGSSCGPIPTQSTSPDHE